MIPSLAARCPEFNSRNAPLFGGERCVSSIWRTFNGFLNSRIIVELASSILVAYLLDLLSQEVFEVGLLKRD